MRFVRRFFRVIFAMIGVCAVLVAASALLAPFLLPLIEGGAPPDAPTSRAPAGPITGTAYPGDPHAEAAIVAAEDARLVDVRSAAASRAGAGVEEGTLFRVLTEPRATLVVPEREESYTLEELAEEAPESVEVTSDGSYLVK